ncbi:hypothetical protein [Oricola sp.]|uniref:hypothetical protein n=1 Tax=Oricola sp. TaxID=1979950 RepID=UPI0025F4408A|nr:hypothetical protein [Oricola sp.]MCI5077934.1 hypothetical protein [Oricola sp.]
MASDRETAKGAVVQSDDNDPELENALENAAKLQLDLKREDNRHREAMNAQNLGFVGNLFGDGKSIPTTAALVTVLLAFGVAIGLYIAAYNQPVNGDMWFTNAERSLSVALAALAYVFGKGGK